ncbi:GMC oxidoreductase [Scleroderma citrinum Foug A]|uniref:GMC oxidoreductase n=1 Tax=Scleroderma citrinum Foug A TaxID=1036808 RepID=A0A0C3AGW6_9AGAM|nr:GMC oxidoreductase [Scleroderma citrinum Foug A]
MWPFTNSQFLSLRDLHTEYDFIVVGGGNAGCVLARRLSEDPSKTVLLIERGDGNDSWLDRTPLLSTYHFSNGKHSDVFPSAFEEHFDRTISCVTGLGLGGCTRINGAQYTSGVPAEYNSWKNAGRIGWSYDDLLPFFKKSESWFESIPQEYHGHSGPLHVRSYEEYNYKCLEWVEKACRKISLAPIEDMRSPTAPTMGWNKMKFTLDSSGCRHSAYRAYLPVDILTSRKDRLHVCTGALARKLLFTQHSDGSIHVKGVEIQEMRSGSLSVTVEARCEVVLACGALRTPQLLLLSGIGPQEHLQDMGVDIVLASPGVGNHLQDHLIVPTGYNCPLSDSLWAMVVRPAVLVRELYNYLRYGTGWFLGTIVELEVFGSSSLVGESGQVKPVPKERTDLSDPENIPDIAILASSISDPKAKRADRSQGFVGLNAALLKSTSCGHLVLRSLDPMDAPQCKLNYLSTSEDTIALRAALRLTVEIAKNMRDAGYPIKETCTPASLEDACLDSFIRDKAETMYHYSSTCRMAPLDDLHPGVVDDQLLYVHGIVDLRIADASIFPSVPASHPQALVYAVAEKCADMIVKKHHLQSQPECT